MPSLLPTLPKLPLGVGLAPMEGVTDYPTRLWFRLLASPDSVVTPFLRITPTYPSKEWPLSWAPELLDGELANALASPTIPQLMASDEEHFLRAAEQLLRLNPSLAMVELNCGCPAPTVVGKGAGSGLLQQPDSFRRFIGRLTAVLGPKILSVKMRTGYESAHSFDELLAALADLPLHRLVIHGRSRADRYRGQARWDLIGTAAAQLPYPVIGSGDVTDTHSLRSRLALAPDVQGVIIGRGALRNPWVFTEIRTGENQDVSYRLLRLALESFALCHDSYQRQPSLLIKWTREGRFRKAFARDCEQWQNLNNDLASHLTGWSTEALAPTGGVLPIRTLGRLKMLWSYLRSSLPQLFFDPSLLRSRQLSAFFHHLDALAGTYRTLSGQNGALEDLRIPLRWTDAYDWLYAGEGKKTAGEGRKDPPSVTTESDVLGGEN